MKDYNNSMLCQPPNIYAIEMLDIHVIIMCELMALEKPKILSTDKQATFIIRVSSNEGGKLPPQNPQLPPKKTRLLWVNSIGNNNINKCKLAASPPPQKKICSACSFPLNKIFLDDTLIINIIIQRRKVRVSLCNLILIIFFA